MVVFYREEGRIGDVHNSLVLYPCDSYGFSVPVVSRSGVVASSLLLSCVLDTANGLQSDFQFLICRDH